MPPTPTSTDLNRRIAFILHVGCVELRNLALGEAPHAQMAELADALELLPRYIVADLDASGWETVRFVIENYNAQYPHSGWRLVRHLDEDPPERY